MAAVQADVAATGCALACGCGWLEFVNVLRDGESLRLGRTAESRRPTDVLRDAGESRWPAPAKLNLFLHVTGRRADGYHELQTVFQLIDLADTIGISVRTD